MGKMMKKTVIEPEPRKELREFNYFFKEIDDLYHEIARKIGVSDSVFEILYTILSLGDGCLQKDICRMAFVRKQTVNSSIQKMKQDGLIFLKRGNGREMHIYLTEKGQRFAKEYIAPVIVMENGVFEELTKEERHELLGLSGKYLQCFRRRAKEFMDLV